MERRPAPPVDPDWLGARLAAVAREVGVELPAEALPALAAYATLVLDWGARVNLTGAKSAEALADDHLADALTLLPHLPAGSFRFVDVGSGAGLPGLVLALLRPDAHGTLLEPTRKKQAFLAHAIRTLDLGGRIEARVERLDAHLAAGSGGYDVAVSRAVWVAELWLEHARPLVRGGGLLLGLEGSAERPLPPGARRFPYSLGGRRRAVVTLRC